MSESKFPDRMPYAHEISTQEELNFLVCWLKVLFIQQPNIRGDINAISINLTGKFVGMDQSNTLQICKVEGWNK